MATNLYNCAEHRFGVFFFRYTVWVEWKLQLNQFNQLILMRLHVYPYWWYVSLNISQYSYMIVYIPHLFSIFCPKPFFFSAHKWTNQPTNQRPTVKRVSLEESHHTPGLEALMLIYWFGTVDGSEIPRPTIVWMVLKPCELHGINYLLNGAEFLNHQQYHLFFQGGFCYQKSWFARMVQEEWMFFPKKEQGWNRIKWFHLKQIWIEHSFFLAPKLL